MAPGTTLQTSLAASHPEAAPIAGPSAPHSPADLKGQGQPSSQDLDFAKLKKANGAVQKLISLAEERQGGRTFFQRASDWILRVKQPQETELESARSDLQQAEEYLARATEKHDPKELEQAKAFEKKAFSEIQIYHSKYSDYQEGYLSRIENMSAGCGAISIVTGVAALLIESEVVVGLGSVLGGNTAFTGNLVIGAAGGTALTALGVLGLSYLLNGQYPIEKRSLDQEAITLNLDKNVKKVIQLNPPSKIVTVNELDQRLISVAQNALQPASALSPFNYGYDNFFIQEGVVDKFDRNYTTVSDLRNQYIEALQNKWRKSVDRYEMDSADQDFFGQLNQVVLYLHQEYLVPYRAANANFADLLDGLGGNCEAGYAIAIISAITRTVRIPEPYLLGVEVIGGFYPHLQAVLYNRNTKEAWVLFPQLTKLDKLEGPIYHPNILLHAFLKGRGIDPPVKDESLIIADVGDFAKFLQKITPALNKPTNTKLLFPAGAGYYSLSPSPEEATIPTSQDTVTENGKTVSMTAPLTYSLDVRTLQNLITFFDSPETIADYSEEDLKEMVKGRDHLPPLLRDIKEPLLEKRVKEHPLEFLSLIEALPHEKRKYFVQLLPSRGKQQIYRSLISSQRVSLSTPYKIISIEIMREDQPYPQEKIEDKKEEKSPSLSSENSPITSVVISSECFFDLFFYGRFSTMLGGGYPRKPDSDPKIYFANRWNADLSEEFRRINSTGEYDEMFRNNYQTIVFSRPEQERTIKNPFPLPVVYYTTARENELPLDYITKDIFDIWLDIQARKSSQ